MAIGLASFTLNNLVILPWSFDGCLHVAKELYVIDSLVVIFGFRILKVEGQGFFSYSVTDVENVSNFMSSDSSSVWNSCGGIEWCG